MLYYIMKKWGSVRKSVKMIWKNKKGTGKI
jgi:hypothetical protein